MIKNLDNNEISCVYYQFKEYFDTMNDTLNKGYRTEQKDIQADGFTVKALIVVEISDGEVAALKSSHYYQTVESIIDKLAPIVELIEESEPTIKIKLEQ